jgi:hypothetical protein
MSERSVEGIDREELDASIAPPADGRDGGSFAGCLIVSLVILLPALLYFGFFGILLLDAFVLNTNYFTPEHVSAEVIYGIEVVYAPLIYLVRWAMEM